MNLHRFGRMAISIPFNLLPYRIPESNFSLPKSLNPISIPPPHRYSIPRAISFPKFQSNSLMSSVQETSNSSHSSDELPPKLQEIVELFQSVNDPKAKYEQLLFYGKNLRPLDSHFKTFENKVHGCVSQVWVRAYLDDERNVHFEADSDSVLTKGLAALLVNGLSGRSVEEIVGISPDFALLLGLQQSLTPSRNNGFLNMLKMMQKKALDLSRKTSSEVHPLSEAFDSDTYIGGDSVSELDEEEHGSSVDGSLGTRYMRIKQTLEKELNPSDLLVADISHQHAGHAAVRGSTETHFNVRVVSKEFDGLSMVKRHQVIYNLLQPELDSGLHALSIVAKTPSEVSMK